MAEKTERAVLAGGCFWGMQDLIRKMSGVVSTRVGYSGGDVKNATYRNHGTHAEAIEIIFDPAKIGYHDLLDVFFTVHDPTTLNQQGNDVGEQYRSVIFHLSDEQKKIAQDVIAEWTDEKAFPDPIVTAVEPAQTFYVAEDYHQDYFKNHPMQPYCLFTVAPKVKKVRQKFAARLKAEV